MTRASVVPPVAIAAAVGGLLWMATAMVTGRREAWDATAYWVVAYPIALLACAALGRNWPERPWRWALAVFEAQALAMGLRNGEVGSLLPMGMLLFAILAVPGMAVAHWMAAAARNGTTDEG